MTKLKSISRISQMEALFDEANEKLTAFEKQIAEFRKLRENMKKLESYYTSAEWKKDFALDEEGMLPKDLKRGVLSEDGIYNLLERYRILLDDLE